MIVNDLERDQMLLSQYHHCCTFLDRKRGRIYKLSFWDRKMAYFLRWILPVKYYHAIYRAINFYKKPLNS